MGFIERINICSILDLELWEIFESLLSVWSLSIRRLVVETDSLGAYRLIKEYIGSCGSTLLPYILDLIARPWEIQLRHVRRGSNTLADRVAKLVTEEDFLCHRYIDPPSSCIGVLLTKAALAEGGVDG
ncbi:hypothetical protein V6N11_019775 [Hibiscus sabdariffa]|uniref:RNase H type-1 domain-containing protein n=2 Tax=Hibiscus sabdariffa TaxID=183260 RepID=A0ABR2AGZ0_9ROSI